MIAKEQISIPQEKQPGPASFQKQAEALLFACLAFAGRRDVLEAYSRSRGDGSAAPEHQYYLALALAREGAVDEALVILRKAIVENPRHQQARKLAYRLIIHLAESMAKEANWQRVSDLIVEAMQIRPEGVDPAVDFARFRGALPISHLRSGQREEAARLWEQQLLENPHDPLALHNLALMHYWWARGIEKDGNSSCLVQRWRPAIMYWSLLQQVDAFWTHWGHTRARAWGFPISEYELATLRKKLLETQFDHCFQDRMDDARQRNQAQLAQQYDECLSTVLLERRSAECWKQVIKLFPPSESVASWLEKSTASDKQSQKYTTRENHGWIVRFFLQTANTASASLTHAPTQLLDLPGGVGFFRHFGLIPRVAELASSLDSIKGAEQCIANLRILSPDNLGHILVLVEDRNSPAEAIDQLSHLPQSASALPEFVYLRSLALYRRGEQLSGHGEFASAFDCWKQAYQLAKADCSDPAFSTLLKALCASVQSHVVAAAQKEAKKLKAAGNNDAAILVLEQSAAMDKDGVLVGYLCGHLCDRGGVKLGKDDYSGARKDLSRVLELKPDYERAKQGMSTTYNNEGVDEKNSDKKIGLFESALKWHPSNFVAKKNLAMELCGKAVKRVNSSSGSGVRYAVDDAIKLLERAFGLVSSELKPGALLLIEQMAEVDPSLVKGLIGKIDDDALKRVAENLGTAYNMRARIRRGY